MGGKLGGGLREKLEGGLREKLEGELEERLGVKWLLPIPSFTVFSSLSRLLISNQNG